jgi:hypothetical protein
VDIEPFMSIPRPSAPLLLQLCFGIPPAGMITALAAINMICTMLPDRLDLMMAA